MADNVRLNKVLRELNISIDRAIDFLESKGLNLKEIASLYVNRGPGSFAGIRNSLSIVKAMHFIQKIDYYCYSFKDFKGENDVKYENIPNLCDKFKVKKNLINPIYLS